MGDVVVDEAAQDVDDRIGLADVAEELVAEPFALRRAADQPGDVGEAQLRLDDLGAARDPGDGVEARVGDGDVPDVRLDRAERIIRRRGRGRFRQRIEQRRLADIGKADDAATETHDLSFAFLPLEGGGERHREAVARVGVVRGQW